MQLVEAMLEQAKLDSVTAVLHLPGLHRAAYYGFDDVVSAVLAEGCVGPDEVDAHGETPLHIAVRMSNEEVAVTLLEHGASPNVASQRGMTPLHWAALTGQERLSDRLLAKHASADAQAWAAGGVTPVDVAMMMGQKELAKRMRESLRRNVQKQLDICPLPSGTSCTPTFAL
jgi:ankyrin repeat protein